VEIVIRALVVYVLLWILVRAVGKRELGELTAFELLLLVVLGDLVQQGVTQEDYTVTGALLSVSTIALVVVASSYVSFRFRKPREVIENLPALVVRDGRFQDDVIRVERITHDEILDAARQKGIVDLRDVEVGILENDGRFSFLLHQAPTAPTPLETQVAKS
jgi:uncharacterized membrane protein YcaP (DUF421 family)